MIIANSCFILAFITVNSENLASFLLANSVKRHICDVQYSRLSHDLPMSINERVNCYFARVKFSRNFAYAKFRENISLTKIPNLQYRYKYIT